MNHINHDYWFKIRKEIFKDKIPAWHVTMSRTQLQIAAWVVEYAQSDSSLNAHNPINIISDLLKTLYNGPKVQWAWIATNLKNPVD